MEDGDDTAATIRRIVKCIDAHQSQKWRRNILAKQRRCCKRTHVCVYRYRCTSDCRTLSTLSQFFFIFLFASFKNSMKNKPIHSTNVYVNFACLICVHLTMVHHVVAAKPIDNDIHQYGQQWEILAGNLASNVHFLLACYIYKCYQPNLCISIPFAWKKATGKIERKKLFQIYSHFLLADDCFGIILTASRRRHHPNIQTTPCDKVNTYTV